MFLCLNLPRTWLNVSLTLIISHVLLDYLGNGVALFYPFIKEEYIFHIINHESLLLIFLLLGVGLYFIFKKRSLMISFLITFTTVLVLIGMSKLYLEHRLQKQFGKEDPYLIVSYPSNKANQWEFMVRTNEHFYTGVSPYFPIHIETINIKDVKE